MIRQALKVLVAAFPALTRTVGVQVPVGTVTKMARKHCGDVADF